MKTAVYLSAITILLFSCKKEEAAIQEKIIGKWELRVMAGGITGQRSTYPTGNGQILEFAKTTYSDYCGNQLTKNGTYSIIKDTTRFGEIANRIVFDGVLNPGRTFLSIENNRLNLHEDAADGGTAEYEKIQ